MVKKISAPRGTTDILSTEMPLWQDIESKSRKILGNYNYKEIRTPLFEETGLFKRSLGQTSDVVNKQLLELASDKKEGFSLRPEGTASIVRSYIENNLDRKEGLSKFYYMGPMFRGERPQKGRLRQFHQIGVEVIGPSADHPHIDAEVIALNVYLLEAFGVKNFELKINTLGSLEDKKNFAKELRGLLGPMRSSLCAECRRRFDHNVFRILDCKNTACSKIIRNLKINNSHLSKESCAYFEQVKEALKILEIEYNVCCELVRGLDYYTHTVFEISSSSLGSQDAVSAGGRYNNLVSQLGGAQVAAIGFALGIERAILAIPKAEILQAAHLDAFIIPLEEKFFGKAFHILKILRHGGISSDMSYSTSSVKNQMRLANKNNVKAVVIFGEDEDKKSEEVITLKDMGTGGQREVYLNELIGEIEKIKNRYNR